MKLEWTDDGWRRRFAILPIYLSDGPNKQIIWLQWVWKRDMCLFTEVRLTDPRAAQAIEARRAATTGAVHESASPEGCAPTGGPTI